MLWLFFFISVDPILPGQNSWPCFNGKTFWAPPLNHYCNHDSPRHMKINVFDEEKVNRGSPFFYLDECEQSNIGMSREQSIKMDRSTQIWLFGFFISSRDGQEWIFGFYIKIKNFDIDFHCFSLFQQSWFWYFHGLSKFSTLT